MSHGQDQSARDAGSAAETQSAAAREGDAVRPAASAQATGTPATGTPVTGTQVTGTPATGTQVTGTQQDVAARQYVPRPTESFDDAGYVKERPTGAVLGFTITASVLMMVSGLWNFLEGLAGIIKGQFFVVTPNYVYSLSATSWGWIHLIVGAVVFVAGAFLFMDKLWARIVGVVLACISGVINFLYIPYSPVWSVIIIALDVFIVWALLAPRRRYAD